jgi:hypothetical protein
MQTICVNTFHLRNEHIRAYDVVCNIFFTDSIEERFVKDPQKSIKSLMKDSDIPLLENAKTVDVFTSSKLLVQKLGEAFANVHFDMVEYFEVEDVYGLSSLEDEVFYEEDDFDATPSFVEERLYIGSSLHAGSQEILERLSINVIVNCADDVPNFFEDSDVYGGPFYEYKNFPISDKHDTPIEKYFNACSDYIDTALKDGKTVLVHCYAGKSRSAAFVIAFLMLKRGMTYADAYTFLISCRSCISPNIAFATKLMKA